MESYHYKILREAGEKLAALVDLPLPDGPHGMGGEGLFDPWDMFPLCGSYSSEFDECALDVLRELQSGDKHRRDLASEMFREMLCHLNLCEYGTSPRACFPTPQLRELLPRLIEKWERYTQIQWGSDDQP